MKQCATCKLQLDLTHFGKIKSSKDGLRKECKKCRNTREKKYKDKKANYDKNYRDKNKKKIKTNIRKGRLDTVIKV